MAWYYLDGENERGPLNPEDMSALVAAGTIAAETRVWRDGWDDWKPAGEINFTSAPARPPKPSGMRLPATPGNSPPPRPEPPGGPVPKTPAQGASALPAKGVAAYAADELQSIRDGVGNLNRLKNETIARAVGGAPRVGRILVGVGVFAIAIALAILSGRLGVAVLLWPLLLATWWICAVVFRFVHGGPPWARAVSSWTFSNLKLAGIGSALAGVVVLVAAISWLVIQVNAAERASNVRYSQQLAADAQEREAKEQADMQQARLAKERADSEARAQAEARAKALRTNAAANAVRFRDEMQSIVQLIQVQKYDEAVDRGHPLVDEATEYSKLDPVPAEILPLLPQLMDLASRVNRLSTVSTAVHDLPALKEQAKELAQSQNNAKDWSMIVDIVANALRQVEVLENADAEARRLIPAGLNLRQERASLERQRDIYRERRHQAEEAEAADRKAAEDAAAQCGPQPRRSEWDGEVSAVTYFVKESAHDPSSIEVKDCSVPVLTTQDCWVTTCAVRGKNVLGAMVLERVEFSIAPGGVRRR